MFRNSEDVWYLWGLEQKLEIFGSELLVFGNFKYPLKFQNFSEFLFEMYLEAYFLNHEIETVSSKVQTRKKTNPLDAKNVIN